MYIPPLPFLQVLLFLENYFPTSTPLIPSNAFTSA